MIWLLKANVTVAVGRVPGGLQEGRRVAVLGATAWRTTVARSRVSVHIPCEGEAGSGFDGWNGVAGTALLSPPLLHTHYY